MLVLSRRVGESIRIGNAVLTVLKIKGRQISVGVEASKEIPVQRTELDRRPPPNPKQPVAA